MAHRTNIGIFLIKGLFLFFAFCLYGCQVTQVKSIPADRITYSSYVPENWDIYYFNKLGEPGRILSDDPSLDYEPAISPDGRWVVFTSERNGNPDLFVIDLNSKISTATLLIESNAMEDQVAFSPDGKKVYFVSTRDGNADIYSLPFLPETIQSIDVATNLTQHPDGDFRPSVSPNGKQLAFSTDRDTPTTGHHRFTFARQREGEIYVMNLDKKSKPTRITHTKDWDGSPIWSEDGKSLFYYSAGGRPHPPQKDALTQEGDFRIWSVNIDNPIPRPLSPEGIEALWPALMPNGRIAFATRLKGGYEANWKIVSINQDGSDFSEVSDTNHSYWAPDFNTKTGAMVVHGTGNMKQDVMPGCGFSGQLLASGNPIETQFKDKIVQLFPMRHAFSVVPHPFKPRIALNCHEKYGGSIATARFDGSNPSKVVEIKQGTKPGSNPFGIKWSKDGSFLTYMLGRFWGKANFNTDIEIISSDGGIHKNLSEKISANDGMPSFSKDGKTLVFRSGRSGTFDLYVMPVVEPDNAMRITDSKGKDNFPVFSPTTDEIAFISNRDGVPDATGYRQFDIYLLKPNNKAGDYDMQRITKTKGQDAHVQFSPDGKWLIFTSEQGGINDEEPLVQEVFFAPQMYGEIYAYRLSDGYQVRLTHNKWEDGAPFWVGPTLTTKQSSD